MRVAVLHSRYHSRFPSGENLTVTESVSRLRHAGVDVFVSDTASDSLTNVAAKVSVAARPLTRAGSGNTALFADLMRFKPDLVHVHNPYPFVSPAMVRHLARLGMPIIHTLHNFRHSCIAGTHQRRGSDCQQCGISRLAAVVHACYRGSRPQSALLAASESHFSSFWREGTAATFCVSEFMATYARGAGFNPDRLRVLYNAVNPLAHSEPSSRDVLFSGRLEDVKGVTLLLDAWSMLQGQEALAGVRLHVAGSGPLQSVVEARAHQRVVYHGQLSAGELESLHRSVGLVAVPSQWGEPFGRVVAEAASAGRAAIVSDQGALPELVVHGRTGWVISGGAAEWANALKHAILTLTPEYGHAARQRYLALYSEDAVAGRQIELYAEVLGRI